MFRQGHANLFNFGGGMNYWFHHRLGTGWKSGITSTPTTHPCIIGDSASDWPSINFIGC
jgi:hypothetical protein